MIECATQANGAVYDLQVFHLGNRDYLVAGINAHVKVYWMESDVPELDERAEIDSQIICYKIKVEIDREGEQARILVADIMKSLSIYRFSRSQERLQIEARDPNGLWCIEMAKVPFKQDKAETEEWDVEEDDEQLDNDFYLTADFD